MIPPDVKHRFAGDSGIDVVTQEIDVLFPDGERLRVVLRVGAPFRRPERNLPAAWWVRSELENLDVTAGPLGSADPLHTLITGLYWIYGRMDVHERKSDCRYVWPGTDDPFEFRELFKSFFR